jgi:predicted phage terminase large subunit-like protein
LPAIAEEDERIPIGNDKFHYRRAGDPLHPEREPMSVLESLRAQLGPDIFAAQYQQRPVAPGGAMIKREWIRRYDELPRPPSRHIIQSWDIASKEGEENDWSVCTTWLICENRYYLVDVMRGRFDYPTLKARVTSHAELHSPSTILIEDAGVGIALIQDLRDASFSVVPVKPEHDKRIRMSIQSAKFESGRVFFPEKASWLADLESELLAFPRGRIGRATVSCQPHDLDRYGRVVAVCFKGSEDLSRWMVVSGWAVAFRRYSVDYVADEAAARRSQTNPE